jgi:predicted transcriptional regulator
MRVIRDVMSQQVVTIRSDAKLTDAVQILTEHDLSGAPVVSAKGQVVGFISEPALMDVLFDREARCAKVSERMTRDVHMVRPDEPLAVAARISPCTACDGCPLSIAGRWWVWSPAATCWVIRSSTRSRSWNRLSN